MVKFECHNPAHPLVLSAFWVNHGVLLQHIRKLAPWSVRVRHRELLDSHAATTAATAIHMLPSAERPSRRLPKRPMSQQSRQDTY